MDNIATLRKMYLRCRARVIVHEKPVEEKPSMMDWIRSEFQAIKAAIKNVNGIM